MFVDYQLVAEGATKRHKDTKDIFIYRGGIIDRRTGGTGGASEIRNKK